MSREDDVGQGIKEIGVGGAADDAGDMDDLGRRQVMILGSSTWDEIEESQRKQETCCARQLTMFTYRIAFICHLNSYIELFVASYLWRLGAGECLLHRSASATEETVDEQQPILKQLSTYIDINDNRETNSFSI